jgi:hypothetical protein
MEDQQANSIPALIRSVLDDARELIREEIAVARSEIREEMSSVRSIGLGFGAAAIAGIVSVVLLCVAIGGAIADLFDWPAWSGYGLMALLLGVGAYLAARYGQGQLARIRALPKTTATLRENIAWIQDKSAPSSSNIR